MKSLRIPLLLAASLAAVPAAGTAQQQDVVWNTQGVTKNEVVLGMHTDLSGVAASFGVPVANVARLRVEQVNAAGGIHGRKLRLVIEDNGYQVPRAVQAANKLINSDKVFAMIGAAGTPMNNAALPAQLKAGVPNLFPVSWARAMAEPLHPLKFVLYASYPDQIRGAVKWFVETRGKKRICSMYQDTDFGREIHGGALAQVRLMGLELAASSSHRPTDTDFTVAINRLREAKCDLVTMGSIVRDTIIAYTTARKIGWNDVDFVGTAASYDLAISGAEGGATEGYYTVGLFDVPNEKTVTPQAAAFMKTYRERYNTEPTIQVGLGYMAMELTLEALRKAGPNLTTKSLVSALEGIRNFPDAFGGPPHGFSAEQHFSSRESVLYQVKGRQWVRVGPMPKP
jgi:branched-chain amino acid transport system substrate-binding protein